MFEKLKREWKTFLLAIVTTAVGMWDVVAGYGYDYSQLISEQYRIYVVPVIGVSFLLLRRWAADTTVEKTTETTVVETVVEKPIDPAPQENV